MTEAKKPEDNSAAGLEMRLSTRDLPREQQFESWRNAMNGADTPVQLELEHPEMGFAADMLLRGFGLMQLAYTVASATNRNPVRFTRERSEIARTQEHSLLLAFNLSGSVDFVYNNASPKVATGTWSLLNTEDRMAGAGYGSQARQIQVRIPPEASARLARLAGRFLGVPMHPGNMANALVCDYLKALVRYPMPDAAQAAAIGRHLEDMLALALNQTSEQFEASQGGVRAALVMAIEREIETHYLDHEFNPVSAAANLHITPRYLHKILEPTGMSFSERVMQRRLRHAHGLLSLPGAAHQNILDIALDSGFRRRAFQPALPRGIRYGAARVPWWPPYYVGCMKWAKNLKPLHVTAAGSATTSLPARYRFLPARCGTVPGC